MERMQRRAFLRRTLGLFGAAGVSALVAACAGGGATLTSTTAPAPTPRTALTQAPPTATPTAAPTVTPTSPKVSAEPMRIGILLTLSGPASPNGEANLRGLQLAF